MKKLRVFFTIIVLFQSLEVFSQENLILKKIQEQKGQGVEFIEVRNLFSIAEPDFQLISKVSSKSKISFYKYDRSKFGLLGEAISLKIPMKERELELELLHVPGTFYSYSVVTSDGKSLNADEGIKHYRGVVKGEESSLVAFSFSENEVIGLVATDEGNFNFAAISNGEKYVFFNENDIAVTDFSNPMQFENDVADSRIKSYDPKVLSQESKLAINSSDKCVRFYFETEFDIFQNKGSVQNVELFVTSIYNQVAILYQNENIGTYISQIFIWNAIDPYTENNTEDLLDQFKLTRTSFEGDLGHLLTFRSVGGGRAAGYNGLCNNSTGEKLAVAGISPTFNNFPIYSWPVKVITHEFGHLLGSQHTHACIWNGNNTAIDGCVNTTCWNPGHPSGGGTIMSYCNQIPGVGVNFTRDLVLSLEM